MAAGMNPITLTRLAHVYYKHKDAVAARQFLMDFGFTETKQAGLKTFFRGYGTEPFLVCVEQADQDAWAGAAFAVDTAEDLQRAATTLPPECRATDVHEMADEPGGGFRVTFFDPVDGFPMHLVYGQQPVDALDPGFSHTPTNYPTEKNRHANAVQRFAKRPAPIHKLGHFGMCVTDFARSYAFYTAHFNLYPSELLYNAADVDHTAFFRLNRGAQHVDHHIFFLYKGPAWHVHHTSYETHDFDTQLLGHDWLRTKGYENCWGVGRHVMGSQIFDYWFDPAGFILEHYVDGDQLNMSERTHYSLDTDAHLHVWGPDVPETFLT